MKRNKNKFYKLICVVDLDNIVNAVVKFREYSYKKEDNLDPEENKKALINNIKRKWEYFNVKNKCKDIVKENKIFEMKKNVLSEKALGNRFKKENIKYNRKFIEQLLSVYKEEDENIYFDGKFFINKDELRIYMYFKKIIRHKNDLKLIKGYKFFSSLDDDYKIKISDEFVILNLFNYLMGENMVNDFINNESFRNSIFNKVKEKLKEINLNLDENFKEEMEVNY